MIRDCRKSQRSIQILATSDTNRSIESLRDSNQTWETALV